MSDEYAKLWALAIEEERNEKRRFGKVGSFFKKAGILIWGIFKFIFRLLTSLLALALTFLGFCIKLCFGFLGR